MGRQRKGILAFAAALALIAAGSAIAATGLGHRNATGLSAFATGERHGDDLAAAASYLGITTSDLLTQLQSGKTLAQIADATSGKSAAGLVAALVAHEKQELAAAVAAGKLTQAQSDAIAANLMQRFTDLVNGVRPQFGAHRHGAFFPRDGLAAAASYLGITTDDLLTQLRSGKTLAQIADATSGKSAAGLIAALVARAKEGLADAVSAGKLTQAQSDAISARLQQLVTDLLNGGFPAFGPGRLHRGFFGRNGTTT